MASLRAAKANGLNIQKVYLDQQPKVEKVLRLEPAQLTKVRRGLRKNAAELVHNMPILQGPKSILTDVLRALAQGA